ncbi:histidine phosphatase family protein [Komagataeibacter sp. FNDCF1]|uniref:SixA phosphatase family protein n=1 Tax=Komagataeibacter sp. FNDCF1 TaxID=2878681 RepID=UPI001E590595|nr:histidine phosphatase family protein [Komagataeibacter sp. FNDCF1]MCE2563967.1 histidine phosphatase family protein [Komagataeibacter sp. FNDCF1]
MTDTAVRPASPAGQLVLIRHAQAAPAPFGEMGQHADMRRPLTARGHDMAARCGAWLRECLFAPDLVLVSPALRTLQTLEGIGSFYGDRQPAIRHVNALYDATTDTIRDMLYEVPDKCSNIIILGHNPGLSALVCHWAAGRCPAALEPALHQGFPPAAMACFTTGKPWNTATDSEIRLQDLYCQ